MLAALLTPSLAQAVVLSHDSFSISGGYTAGELPGQNPPVTGYTGAWTDIDFGDAEPGITAGSLNYSNGLYLGSSGDKVSVASSTVGGENAAGNSGRVFRVLDSSLVATSGTAGTVYMSFLFQSGEEVNTPTIYQTLALYDTTTSDANRNFDIGLTTNGGQTGEAYNFGVDGAYTSTGVAADTGVHLFVVKFDLSTAALGDSVTVWIDPTLGGTGDPTGGITVTGKDLTWNRLAFSDYDANSAAWDEIRWGTDFEAVTVPEPASALLGSFGVLALLRRRRK